MSNKNTDKKIVFVSKKEKNNQNLAKKKSPFLKDKIITSLGDGYYLSNNSQYYTEMSPEKNKNNFQASGKKSQLSSKFNNNINNYGFNDNSYAFPRDISILTDSNLFDNSSTNTNSNNTINNIKTKGLNNNISLYETKNTKKDKNKVKNMNYSTKNKSSSFISSSSNNTILNKNLGFNQEPFDSKYSFKINKIKDDYIDFLQKEFEDNTKNNAKLDLNHKELLKRCDDLIHDNKILTNTLNDRTNRLNKITQENLYVKTELDKAILNNQKNEQKLVFYEEQFKLYKTNNENYQKIIEELKEQNNQLNLNLNQMEQTNQENQKQAEEKLKEEIENTKKDMEEMFMNKRKEDNVKIEEKTKIILEQVKLLQEKNEELTNELNKKEQMFELVCKDNEKLTNENNLYRSQVDQFSHQISELNTIIKHKDNLINTLKTENLNSDKFLNKSSSCSMMKFDGSEYINENISKLITDNEENKMRIELLNNKIKSIDEIEKKYNELMNGKRTLTLSEKLALHMGNNENKNSSSTPKKVGTHFKYNGINEIKNATYQKNLTNNTKNYKNLMSPKNLQLHVGEINDILNSPDIFMTKNDKKDFRTYNKDNSLSVSSNIATKKKAKDNNIFISSSNLSQNRKEMRQKKLNESLSKIIEHKNSVDREIKVNSRARKKNDKPEKLNTISKSSKKVIMEIQGTSNKIRNYKRVENKILDEKDKKYYRNHGKELETEKDEVRESLREMNRKKNYTHKPKINNHSLEEKENEQNNKEFNIIENEEEEKKKVKFDKIYYLYGIDRNDDFHTFNINEKKWMEIRKIYEIELDEKSDTFKKDYQYDGTLLYNNLIGLYILTGAKTDTLYYFNSLTNKITKICKFNNSHDNGSIMYDSNNNCLYVFGGKKITSCEYFSFNDKKVYKLPDLIYDRANASFIVSNNKIFGFFGFSYSKDTFAKTIEYMDYNRKDKWVELKNIQFLKDDISFDTESVSTMYYRQNQNQILIYCGIHGDEEEFVTEYYLLYDSKNNTMDKINKWEMQQFKAMGKKWKSYNFKKSDLKGFHFAKNSRFLLLPKDISYEGYNEKDPINILIDYKNNVHYILQNKEKIDIYRSDM